MDKRKLIGFPMTWLVVFLSALPWDSRLNVSVVEAKATAVETEEDPSIQIYLPIIAQADPSSSSFYGGETTFGVELHPISPGQGLEQVADTGTSFTRLNGIRWSDVEPSEGQRNWSALADEEEQLLAAAENGIQVVLVVRQTPLWAQKIPGALCGPIKEDKLEAFGSFLHDLVARYSVAPYNIKYWELYNEPDVDPDLVMPIGSPDPFGCWGDASDDYYGGGYYAEMLKAAYPKIKQADPQAQVLVGGILMSCNPASGKCNSDEEILASKFFEGILANQGGAYFDGVAFHNYDIYIYRLGAYFSRKWDSSWDTTGPALIAKARFLKDLMQAYGVSGKFLINSETAVLCGSAIQPPASPGCESDPNSDFELTKAYYLAQSYAAAISEGLRANIWYSLMGWRNSGLLYSDFTPRPAYVAYQFARIQLGGVEYIGPIDLDDTGGTTGLQGYKFQRPDGRLTWIVWALDTGSHTFTPVSLPDAAWDVFGNPVSLSNPASLTITLEPLYIEWGP
jgi:hypothetical protein